VLSIQIGINEPRYVGMRGIRQATLGASELGLGATVVAEAVAKDTLQSLASPDHERAVGPGIAVNPAAAPCPPMRLHHLR
jgi:hypothetical protein